MFKTYGSVNTGVLLEEGDEAILGVVAGVLGQTLGDDQHSVSECFNSEPLLASDLVLVLLESLGESEVARGWLLGY